MDDFNKGNNQYSANNKAGLFEDVGDKIKAIGVAVLVVGILVSFICGVYCGTLEMGLVESLLIVLFGSIWSFISSLLMYGFGILVSNSEKMMKLKELDAKKLTRIVKAIEKNNTKDE